MKKITAILEKGKDGYGVSFPNIENVFAFGETVEKARQEAYEALDGYLEVLEKCNQSIPAILKGSYKLNFEFDPVTLLEYAGETVTWQALSRASGINAAQISHYATRQRTPRPDTRQKLVEGLHTLGKELLGVS